MGYLLTELFYLNHQDVNAVEASRNGLVALLRWCAQRCRTARGAADRAGRSKRLARLDAVPEASLFGRFVSLFGRINSLFARVGNCPSDRQNINGLPAQDVP